MAETLPSARKLKKLYYLRKKAASLESAPTRIVVTDTEVIKKINDLLAAVRPDRPENFYMTPFMREKINWVYVEISSKRLKIRPYVGFYKNPDGTENHAVLMSSDYVSVNDNGKPPYGPCIDLSVSKLFTYLHWETKGIVGFDQKAKNIFALSLVHEAAHFERPREYFFSKPTRQQKIDEECRVWWEVDLNAVRHLREIGQPMDDAFIETDDIIRRCGDGGVKCPGLVDFIAGGTEGISRYGG